MSSVTVVTCDGCKAEISTTTQYSSEQYLALSPVAKTNNSGFSYGMAFVPEIRGVRHFHSLHCLRVFLEADAV